MPLNGVRYVVVKKNGKRLRLAISKKTGKVVEAKRLPTKQS